MAQGDSISGSVDITSEQGEYGYFIRPPIGEVWLITLFYGDVIIRLTNGVVTYEEPGYREFEFETYISSLMENNPDIRFFIDYNYFILLRGSGEFIWSGVQFK